MGCVYDARFGDRLTARDDLHRVEYEPSSGAARTLPPIWRQVPVIRHAVRAAPERVIERPCEAPEMCVIRLINYAAARGF